MFDYGSINTQGAVHGKANPNLCRSRDCQTFGKPQALSQRRGSIAGQEEDQLIDQQS